MASPPSKRFSAGELSVEILEALQAFIRRRTQLLAVRGLAAALVGLLVTMSAVAVCDYVWILPDRVRLLLSAIAYVLTVAIALYLGWPGRSRRNLVDAARRMESAEPRLAESLWSAVELADPQQANGSPALRNWLQQRVARRLQTLDVTALLPIGLVRPWLVAATVAIGVALVLTGLPTIQFGRRLARALLPGAAIERAALTQIEIIQPDPTEQIVAVNESVGIVVKLNDRHIGRSRSDKNGSGPTARLESRDASGRTQISEMSPRRLEEQVFASILAVGSEPVEYRVWAGDGITAWHRLTPQPRPQIEQFTKRYRYPTYAQLSDRVVREKHGGLSALAGTITTLTVRFNQPVTDAEIRVDGGSQRLQLTPIGAQQREFVTNILVDSSQQYRITARAAGHGLATGMGLVYPITPQPDRPPQAEWLNQSGVPQVVAPLAAIPLAASVTDDLPIDQVEHQWRINDGELQSASLPLESQAATATLTWQFDPATASQSGLSIGDAIESRVVVVDRLGQQGTSPWVRMLVADRALDLAQQRQLNRFADLAELALQWLQRSSDWSDPAGQTLGEFEQTALRLGQQRQYLSARFQELLTETNQRYFASQLEQIDGALFQTNQLIDELTWKTLVPGVVPSAAEPADGASGNHLTTAESAPDRLASLAAASGDYLRTVASAHLLRLHIAEALAMRQLAGELLDPPDNSSADRRYLGSRMLWTQFKLMNERLTRRAGLLIDPVNEQFATWQAWADQPSADLQTIPPSWLSELDDRLNRWIEDGRLRTALKSTRDSLNRSLEPIAVSIRSLQNTGTRLPPAEYPLRRDQLLAAITAAQQRQAALRWNRPRHLADLGLLRRAVGNLTGTDNEIAERHPPGPHPPGAPLEALATAWEVIDCADQMHRAESLLRWIVHQERRPQVDVGTLMEHRVALETAVDSISRATTTLADSVFMAEPLEFSLNRPALQRARQLLSQRGVDGILLNSAAPAIERIAVDLHSDLDRLEPVVAQARTMLERYARSLGSLANDAAAAARQAQQAADSAQPLQLQQEFERVEALADELIEALIDFANARSTGTAAEIELAQDADAARATIATETRAAGDAVSDAIGETTNPDAASAFATAETHMQRLADSLELAGEHFAAAERGEDISESRGALRRASANAVGSSDLADRYDQLKSLATAAARDAAQLRQQLDDQARRDQPLQAELAELAANTVQAALQSLRQADRDQRALTRRMEMADPVFHSQSVAQAASAVDLVEQLNQLQQVHHQLLSGDAYQALDGVQQQLISQSIAALDQAAAAAEVIDPLQPQVELATAIAQVAKHVESAREAMRKVQEVPGDAESKSTGSRQFHRQQAELWLRDARDRAIEVLRQRQRKLAAEPGKSPQAAAIAGEIDQLQAEPIEPLQEGNARGEATGRLATQFDSGLQQVGSGLRELAQLAQQISPLRLPASAAAALADQQAEVAREIDRIGNDLRRVAMHRQRIGHKDDAAQLEDSAARVKAIAKEFAGRTAEDLRRSASAPELSAAAHGRATETVRRIQLELSRWGELAEDSSEVPSAATSAAAPSEQTRRQASTLDELDRAFQQQPAESQSLAYEASPTLSEALTQTAAETARARSQAPGAESDPTRQPTSAGEQGSAGGRPLGGAAGEPGSLSTEGVERRGTRWGELREQRGREGSGSDRGEISAAYRRQIEAYFRVIARPAPPARNAP